MLFIVPWFAMDWWGVGFEPGPASWRSDNILSNMNVKIKILPVQNLNLWLVKKIYEKIRAGELTLIYVKL